MLLLLLFVLFVWFGGKYVPKSICKYKDVIFGIFIGLVLSSFMGMRLEGFKVSWGKREYSGNSAGDCIAYLLSAAQNNKERQEVSQMCHDAYIKRRSDKATAHAATIAPGEHEDEHMWWHHFIRWWE